MRQVVKDFLKNYMTLKGEERKALNELLKEIPKQEYAFGNDSRLEVNANIDGEIYRCRVVKVDNCGIFVKGNEDELNLTEIGSLNVNYADMAYIMENM